MKPLTDVAIDYLYTRVEEVEDGRPVTRLMARFPLEWQWKHYEQIHEYYAVKPEDLDAQDQLSYEKLSAYVKSFSPAKCVDVNNNLLFDDEGEYLLVNRLINTKALLECSSNRESIRLLGRGRSLVNFILFMRERARAIFGFPTRLTVFLLQVKCHPFLSVC